MRRTAGTSLQSFADPKNVQQAVESGNDLQLLMGALGAVEKGGRAVGGDDSSSQQAAHYWRVLNGQEKQKLGEGDYKKMAGLVAGFVQGPAH